MEKRQDNIVDVLLTMKGTFVKHPLILVLTYAIIMEHVNQITVVMEVTILFVVALNILLEKTVTLTSMSVQQIILV